MTVAAAAALLAGCGGGSGATTGDLSSAGSTASASATPTPDAPTPDATTSDAPAASREVPAACASLTLAAGETYTGAELGECVSRALVSFGSGRMHMTGEDLYGDVDFTYDPDYAFRVEGTSATGAVRMTYSDGTIWLDSGDGPVKGDVTSTDEAQMLAGLAGEMYRVFSDPAMTADLVAASDGWTVDPETALRVLPDDTEVDAFRITSDGPFTWNEMPVQDYIVWYGADWVPVGAQATMAVAGMSATHVQTFYDLGADITIEPLG